MKRAPKSLILFVIMFLLLFAFSTQTRASGKTLTYGDLVNRLISLEGLSVLPPKGETCKQWSSYDRGSKYDKTTDKYINWGANGDGGFMIRQEGDTWVMAEMKGPGCIFRTWSALSKKGHVKIYLDGNKKPVVDLPFEDYFTGKTAPFNYPALSYHNSYQGSRGENLYFPIPYQKSCKIVADKNWGAYYHFDYVTFPAGTKVETFSADLSSENKRILGKVNRYLQNSLGTDPVGDREGQKEIKEGIKLAAGESKSVLVKGARAITALKARFKFADRKEQEVALRRLLLKITFDGREKPAVWCPLGDFFGTTPGINLYKSLITGMTKKGAYSYWYMPFAESALIEIVNEDNVSREFELKIVHAPLARPFKGLGYFHCKWHRDIFPVRKDRWPDWTMLRTRGRGRFCGVMLHVWNPRGGWWGEGDEKFFVDGEKFPSTIGTGSEDYFGYAWCDPHLFQHPFHCQTMTENNRGNQSVLRWQISDSIPFQKSFEGCIEKYYRNTVGTLYACVVCWYLAPGGKDMIGPTPVEERYGYCKPIPPGGAGFKVLGKFRGNVQEQGMSGYGNHKWKNDNQLWWTGARPGDKLNIRLKVKKSGTYKVKVKLTKAVDYGIVQLYINSEKAGKPIDLFNDGVIPTGPIPLGTYSIKKGDNTFTVEIVGANKKAVKSYMFGLDEIILEKEN